MRKIIRHLEEKKLVGLTLGAGCFLIAIAEIALHWLMLKDYPICKIILNFYTYKATNGKGESDTFDTVLPAILLGLLAGLLGKNWPTKKLFYIVILYAVVLVALLPIYTFILGKNLIWWWPNTNTDVIFLSVPAFLKALLLVGFFTYGIRRMFFSDEKNIQIK